MNFLAHAYLSFGHEELLVGNLIADFIRGREQKGQLSPSVLQGIALHHAIDDFTDHHAAAREAKKYLYPATGRYWGVFLDVIYDHFLANDPNCFSKGELAAFSRKVYRVLEKHESQFPPRFKKIFPYMRRQDWLYSYREKAGMNSAFNGIYHRAIFIEQSDAAFQTFNHFYEDLRQCYFDFMPEMIAFSKEFIRKLPLKK